MRKILQHFFYILLTSFILTQLGACGSISFFHNQIMGLQSQIALDPRIRNLQVKGDSYYSDELGHRTYRPDKIYKETYQLKGQFDGRNFLLHYTQTERWEYQAPEWIVVGRIKNADSQSSELVYIPKPAHGERWKYYDSVFSMAVSSPFEAKISKEGLSSWIRKKLLGQKEVIVGIAAIDDEYFIKSDAPDMVKAFFLNPMVRRFLETLAKDGLLPIEINSNGVEVSKGYEVGPEKVKEYLNTLYQIAIALERLPYPEWMDGLE